MKISIITVAYNSAKTIRQTIESVLSQDYHDLEYIIVDGNSKDETMQIVKSFGDKIKFISEPDNGIYDALNKGVKMATGEVVGTIGSDDFYPNDLVISQVADVFKHADLDSVYGDVEFVNPGAEDKVVRFWKGGEYKKSNWLNGWMPPHIAFFVKRNVFEKYGYYTTVFSCAGDYEWMLRVMYKHGISSKYLPKTLLTMRNGGTSTASLKHRYRANMEDRAAWQMNDLKPKWFTLWLKPISKISQLFIKN
jgi:glycosyltransferase involved in cell wall biosynthesis